MLQHPVGILPVEEIGELVGADDKRHVAPAILCPANRVDRVGGLGTVDLPARHLDSRQDRRRPPPPVSAASLHRSAQACAAPGRSRRQGASRARTARAHRARARRARGEAGRTRRRAARPSFEDEGRVADVHLVARARPGRLQCVAELVVGDVGSRDPEAAIASEDAVRPAARRGRPVHEEVGKLRRLRLGCGPGLGDELEEAPAKLLDACSRNCRDREDTQARAGRRTPPRAARERDRPCSGRRSGAARRDRHRRRAAPRRSTRTVKPDPPGRRSRAGRAGRARGGRETRGRARLPRSPLRSAPARRRP